MDWQIKMWPVNSWCGWDFFQEYYMPFVSHFVEYSPFVKLITRVNFIISDTLSTFYREICHDEEETLPHLCSKRYRSSQPSGSLSYWDLLIYPPTNVPQPSRYLVNCSLIRKRQIATWQIRHVCLIIFLMTYHHYACQETKIQNLSNHSFERYTKLDELDLSYNDIRFVAPGAFYPLENLRTLDLSSNFNFRVNFFRAFQTVLPSKWLEFREMWHSFSPTRYIPMAPSTSIVEIRI